MYELRRDGGAPLRRPRVDAWALAATSAPSLLALNFGYRSPSASRPSSTGAGAFCLQRPAVQAFRPCAAGWGQNALAPPPAAIFQCLIAMLMSTSRQRAAPRLR